MSDRQPGSAIEWCDITKHAKVVDGCSPASPGCDNCYAARTIGTRMAHMPCAMSPVGNVHVMHVDTGMVVGATNRDLVRIGKRKDDPTKHRYIYKGRVALNTAHLARALKIPKNGGKAGNRVFWNSWSDTFHEKLTNDEIAAQFAVMAARQDLRFMVLTKRPERARAFFEWSLGHQFDAVALCRWAFKHTMGGLQMAALATRRYSRSWPLPNVAIGVSAEDQHRWDERVPTLLDVPAAYRFVSAEPLLGSICDNGELDMVDQVIIGAESGPGARPMELQWAQDLGRDVLNSGVRLFVKQADVCTACKGWPSGTWREDGMPGGRSWYCDACNGTGIGGKVVKHCPEFWIPGHGTQSWDQHFWETFT